MKIKLDKKILDEIKYWEMKLKNKINFKKMQKKLQ